MLSSIFSGSSGQKESGSFDLSSFVGSVSGPTQKSRPSGSNPKSGVENLLDVSSEKFEKKKFVSAKTAAKPASKPSTTDDKKSKDSKDYGHSSQSHRNGHSDDTRNHKRDDKPRDSSAHHRDSDRSKHSSKYEDYNPLSSKEDSFDVRIKKKLADGQDNRNGDSSPKIKKTTEQPSSPKIKKADPSPAKRPEAPSSKPKPTQPPSSRPNGDSKSSSQHNSSNGLHKDSRHSRPISQKPHGDSIAKKPSSGTSQPSSRPQSAKPTSSSPAPSKSQGSKPVLPGSLSGKPLSKPSSGKPSSMNSSQSRPSGSKPTSNSSMGSKPLAKPGSGSRPVSSQSGVKKDFTSPLPKPSSQRPLSSQSPKPGSGKPVSGAPQSGSKELLRKQMEERRRKEEMLKGKRPMESGKPGGSNLGKRPLDRPDNRHEPGLVKKPMLSMSDKKQALNSIFKGAPKASKRHYDSEEDDYDDNDSFIDDGDQDDEAMKEFGKMMTGYRRKVEMRKPYEDDIDDMEVGYDRIVAEEEWTRHVGEIEDKREAALIEQEMEEERQALVKRKRKLKI